MEEPDPTGLTLMEALHGHQAGFVREFLHRQSAEQMKREPREGSLQHWEVQWQEFLKTVETPQPHWAGSELPQEPTPWDDAKTFLSSFEQVAKACQWPKEEWVARLLPALSHETEQAFISLNDKDRRDYGKVKAAILQGDTLRREKQRQCFRHFCYQEAEGPRGAYSQLQELCNKWLRVENHTKEQILELLILEQLLSVLPTEIQSRVRESGPESCSQAVALAEEFLSRQQEAQRCNDQVVFEEAFKEVTATASEAGQTSSDHKLRHSYMETKQKEYGEASLLAGNEWDSQMEKKQHEFLSGRPEQEERKGICWNQDKAKGQEWNVLKNTDKSILCQGGNFHEIPVQEENQTEIKRRKLLGADWRMHTVEQPNKSFTFGKTYSQRRNLNKHEMLHEGQKPYKCSECGKNFTRSTSLTSHKRVHTGEKPYKCSECGKNFTRSTTLTSHKRIHTGEKPYKCLECGKNFNRRTNLTSHKRMHTGEKPYRCSECGRRFGDQSSLVKHKRTHTGEKPYECSECGKGFTTNTNLTSHLRMHTGEKPYKCSVSGKNFTTSTNLASHQRSHIGEKPYKCSECGMSFSHSTTLTSHQMIHTDKKQHNCLEYTRSFSEVSCLNAYQIVYTG
ncbi:zinc finger protein 391-like isoform X2 [Sphaerodactylus townsendi]|uniref:zinc finger protein 391-like isoform X2 n=1 Tax=Sphaerodactylus townsendi TaxID=933632 RepID=UPI0020262DF8|nr:zinc finger protein 391-like isoform X2 [Sphaerodactylus townsendi]